jgi:hypothetical protein
MYSKMETQFDLPKDTAKLQSRTHTKICVILKLFVACCPTSLLLRMPETYLHLL